MPADTSLCGLVSAASSGSSCAWAAPLSATESAVKRKADLFIPSPPEATRSRLVLGAVAAVDVGMAVHAAAADRAEQAGAGGAAVRQRGGLARMAGVAVALLAQERRARLEQAGDRGAMRLMADRAVFLHRRMVVQERSALLHVAGEAGLGNAVAHQLLRIAAVHVVARRARHAALDDRVLHRAI